jgi:hypothetical protein
MKMLFLALALGAAATGAAAQDRAAAATLPNAFDQPAQAVPQAPAPGEAPATEPVLRDFIADVQAGAIDYDSMTPQLAEAVRSQAATVTPLIQGLGAVRSVAYAGPKDGLDQYRVIFEGGSTDWVIGVGNGKITGVLFRPTPAGEE